MKFLSEKTIKVTNLHTGEVMMKKANGNGNISFDIKRPADFLLLKCDIIAK